MTKEKKGEICNINDQQKNLELIHEKSSKEKTGQEDTLMKTAKDLEVDFFGFEYATIRNLTPNSEKRNTGPGRPKG